MSCNQRVMVSDLFIRDTVLAPRDVVLLSFSCNELGLLLQ